MPAAASIRKHKRVVNSFKIGCDPEFVIISNQNAVVHPRGYFDEIPSGQIGLDGSGIPMELRPTPSYSALELTKNLKDLLKSDYLKSVRNHKWRAGAFVVLEEPEEEETSDDEYAPYYSPSREAEEIPIGGHIHIDIPVDNYSVSGYHEFIIQACDHVTKFLEALNIHPKDECDQRRNDGEYGMFGDFRTEHESEEGHHRIEYRTPCSWLTSPNAALITLTLIKLASASPKLALTVLNGKSVNAKWKSLTKFVQLFAKIDEDAAAVYKLLKSKTKRKELIANVEIDMKKQWGIR
jgi:hypothetical protein